jgi:hypothetical protein
MSLKKLIKNPKGNWDFGVRLKESFPLQMSFNIMICAHVLINTSVSFLMGFCSSIGLEMD